MAAVSAFAIYRDAWHERRGLKQKASPHQVETSCSPWFMPPQANPREDTGSYQHSPVHVGMMHPPQNAQVRHELLAYLAANGVSPPQQARAECSPATPKPQRGSRSPVAVQKMQMARILGGLRLNSSIAPELAGRPRPLEVHPLREPVPPWSPVGPRLERSESSRVRDSAHKGMLQSVPSVVSILSAVEGAHIHAARPEQKGKPKAKVPCKDFSEATMYHMASKLREGARYERLRVRAQDVDDVADLLSHHNHAMRLRCPVRR